MTTVTEEHDRAVQRLGAAFSDQDKSSVRYEAARGTSAELSTEVELHVADEQVAARQAWLRWVEDDGYRGLNAGPFDLRRELDDTLGPAR